MVRSNREAIKANNTEIFWKDVLDFEYKDPKMLACSSRSVLYVLQYSFSYTANLDLLMTLPSCPCFPILRPNEQE
jgi:hypothetical protein